MKPEFIMLVGTQLSGKTTYYRKNFSNYSLISEDFYIETKSKKMGSTYNETYTYLKDDLSEYLKKEYEYNIKQKKSFVYDSMNLTVKKRSPFMKFVPNFYTKKCIFFSPLSYEILVERSKKRLDIYVDEFEISKSLAILEIPKIEEGFDEIITIRGNNE